MRWDNWFSAHASLLFKDNRSHWRHPNVFSMHSDDFHWVWFSRFSCCYSQILSYISASHNCPTTKEKVWRRNLVALYCAVYLPEVQPPLQVPEVPSFHWSPEGENRYDVDCTHEGLYSTVCTLYFVLSGSEPYRKSVWVTYHCLVLTANVCVHLLVVK